MYEQSGRSRKTVAAAILLALLVCLSSLVGCSREEGPKKYQLMGTVHYRGNPIGHGDIVFEPTTGTTNSETVANAWIQEGEYQTEVVGGPHRIAIRDLSGDTDMGGSGDQRSAFQRQYTALIELPTIDSVDDGETVTHDIEIPAGHR
jgi:hypothetical protein